MTTNLTGNLGQTHNVSSLVGGGNQSTPLHLHHPINVGTIGVGQVPHVKLPQASPATSTSMSSTSNSGNETQMLTRARLQDLVREVDPTEQLDEEVEEVLLQLADDFVESAVGSACLLAKHRRATTVDVKDVQLHLERNWNMWIPGFGTDELRPYKRAVVTEAHKQRLALIRKALKKY
ncbi:hypothetical protein J437_LFUL000689 [Ladona fulva]|uniref:Transcription initiation factor TFIID subunit 12 n=1 Tax=Ladona fulva TaxID=123851 RepID=A0A8K0K3D8_LADFU|nr:hypothetical protein J437_LFUL000689 [Ladona fulva]